MRAVQRKKNCGRKDLIKTRTAPTATPQHPLVCRIPSPGPFVAGRAGPCWSLTAGLAQPRRPPTSSFIVARTRPRQSFTARLYLALGLHLAPGAVRAVFLPAVTNPARQSVTSVSCPPVTQNHGPHAGHCLDINATA